jgi:hypothetical protein
MPPFAIIGEGLAGSHGYGLDRLTAGGGQTVVGGQRGLPTTVWFAAAGYFLRLRLHSWDARSRRTADSGDGLPCRLCR